MYLNYLDRMYVYISALLANSEDPMTPSVAILCVSGSSRIQNRSLVTRPIFICERQSKCTAWQ